MSEATLFHCIDPFRKKSQFIEDGENMFSGFTSKYLYFNIYNKMRTKNIIDVATMTWNILSNNIQNRDPLFHTKTFFQSMAYMISSNMDRGSKEFQIEAAISKVYASVSEL